jgi:hypothetical protein
MIRTHILMTVLAAALVMAAAGSAAARDGWRAEYSAPDVKFEGAGDEYVLIPADDKAPFLVAEAFAEGWNSNKPGCDGVNMLEADVFFGQGLPGWEAHVLFDLVRGPDGSWQIEYPEIYHGTVDVNADLIDEWSSYETVTITPLRVECSDNDHLLVELAFEGRLAHTSDGTEVSVQGTVLADYTISDMEQY